MKQTKKGFNLPELSIKMVIGLIVFLILLFWSPTVYSKAHDGIYSMKFTQAENNCQTLGELNVINCNLRDECINDKALQDQWKSYENYLNKKDCKKLKSISEVGIDEKKACTCFQQAIWDSINNPPEISLSDIDKRTTPENLAVNSEFKPTYVPLNTPLTASEEDFKNKVLANTNDPNLKATISNLEKNNLLRIVYSESIKQNFDPYLTLAFITQESKGNINALSFAGAAGLMQLMPQTARDMGINVPNYDSVTMSCYNSKNVVFYGPKVIAKCNACDVDKYPNKIYNIGQKESECDLQKDERFNPEKNIEAGIKYLKQNMNLANNDITKLAATYNGGPGAIQSSKTCVDKLRYECEANTGYAETRKYVVAINTYYSDLITS